MARSSECTCHSDMTCGYCCRNAKPYNFTPSESAGYFPAKLLPPQFDRWGFDRWGFDRWGNHVSALDSVPPDNYLSRTP